MIIFIWKIKAEIGFPAIMFYCFLWNETGGDQKQQVDQRILQKTLTNHFLSNVPFQTSVLQYLFIEILAC